MRKNLKEARQKAGMTQQQMADRLNITLVYYQKIESGSRTGDFSLWDTMEDIIGIHQRISERTKKIVSSKKIVNRNIKDISYLNKTIK